MPDDAVRELIVRPWVDQVVDALGFDPRSAYVGGFWLPMIGPSPTWLVRRLAAGLEASPAGFGCSAADLARWLGLGTPSGRNATLIRSLRRAADFELVRFEPDGTVLARRRLPPLTLRQ